MPRKRKIHIQLFHRMLSLTWLRAYLLIQVLPKRCAKPGSGIMFVWPSFYFFI